MLRQLRQDVGQYLAIPQAERSGEDAKHFVEAPIRAFIESAAPELDAVPGSRPRAPSRKHEDLDIAIGFRDPTRAIRATGRRISEGEELLGHVEIAYAEPGRTWSSLRAKFEDDRQALQQSITAALDHGCTKPWTSLALIGEGWRPHILDIAETLHSAYHERDIHSIPTGIGRHRWWPLPDMIVLPGALLQKHTVYESNDRLMSRQWPIFHFWPTSAEDPEAAYRPLAICVAFVRHFFAMLRAGALVERQAFELHDCSSVYGPPVTNEDFPLAETILGNFVGVLVTDGAPSQLLYLNDLDPPEWKNLLLEQRRCASGSRYFLSTPSVLDPSGRFAVSRGGLLLPLR